MPTKAKDRAVSIKKTIVCDNCGEDLANDVLYGGNGNYIVTLGTMYRNNFLPEGTACLEMPVVLPIKETMHFCNFDCMRKWASDENLNMILQRAQRLGDQGLFDG